MFGGKRILFSFGTSMARSRTFCRCTGIRSTRSGTPAPVRCKADDALLAIWQKLVAELCHKARRFSLQRGHQQGLFANQNIVCKLRDPRTIDFLKEKFGIAAD